MEKFAGLDSVHSQEVTESSIGLDTDISFLAVKDNILLNPSASLIQKLTSGDTITPISNELLDLNIPELYRNFKAHSRDIALARKELEAIQSGK